MTEDAYTTLDRVMYKDKLLDKIKESHNNLKEKNPEHPLLSHLDSHIKEAYIVNQYPNGKAFLHVYESLENYHRKLRLAVEEE